MNDFSELENELKKLRPRATSPDLATRIGRALAEVPSATPTAGVLPRPGKFRMNWIGLGLGLAAAASFLILARVNVDKKPAKSSGVVAVTPAPLIVMPAANDNFLPAGMTQVVYNTRDEGLHFTKGADQPVRRVRSRKRETLNWSNPQTGASLRVTYPSEEVTLIPATGQ
jgi:hypothetical protein